MQQKNQCVNAVEGYAQERFCLNPLFLSWAVFYRHVFSVFGRHSYLFFERLGKGCSRTEVFQRRESTTSSCKLLINEKGTFHHQLPYILIYNST